MSLVCVSSWGLRVGLRAAAAGEARRRSVLLDDFGICGRVRLSPRIHSSAASHPEHLWHSGGLEPAGRL